MKNKCFLRKLKMTLGDMTKDKRENQQARGKDCDNRVHDIPKYTAYKDLGLAVDMGKTEYWKQNIIEVWQQMSISLEVVILIK